MVTDHTHSVMDLPEHIRTCEHSWSPAVFILTIEGDDKVPASRCLRCGVWLAVPGPPTEEQQP